MALPLGLAALYCCVKSKEALEFSWKACDPPLAAPTAIPPVEPTWLPAHARPGDRRPGGPPHPAPAMHPAAPPAPQPGRALSSLFNIIYCATHGHALLILWGGVVWRVGGFTETQCFWSPRQVSHFTFHEDVRPAQ